jgi:hypothetical protein
MIVSHHVLVSEVLGGSDELADGIRIARNFRSGVRDTDFHRNCFSGSRSIMQRNGSRVYGNLWMTHSRDNALKVVLNSSLAPMNWMGQAVAGDKQDNAGSDVA